MSHAVVTVNVCAVFLCLEIESLKWKRAALAHNDPDYQLQQLQEIRNQQQLSSQREGDVFSMRFLWNYLGGS